MKRKIYINNNALCRIIVCSGNFTRDNISEKHFQKNKVGHNPIQVSSRINYKIIQKWVFNISFKQNQWLDINLSNFSRATKYTLTSGCFWRFSQKNLSKRVALRGNISATVQVTDLVEALKDAASLLVCTRKNTFWLEGAGFLWVTSYVEDF